MSEHVAVKTMKAADWAAGLSGSELGGYCAVISPFGMTLTSKSTKDDG